MASATVRHRFRLGISRGVLAGLDVPFFRGARRAKLERAVEFETLGFPHGTHHQAVHLVLERMSAARLDLRAESSTIEVAARTNQGHTCMKTTLA